MKKTRYPVMNMGTVSILTIFIVLCMVTFATLSFISTNKDAAFTRQIADRTTAYYAASRCFLCTKSCHAEPPTYLKVFPSAAA